MADSMFTQKLNELLEAGAKEAAGKVLGQTNVNQSLNDVNNLGKTNAPALPPFPIPPDSQKLLKPEEIKYLHSVPVDKRPQLPVVNGQPNYADKGFQTGYKTLLFDYRDQEAKRKKEEAYKAAQAAAK